jgi:hypothetical protein
MTTRKIILGVLLLTSTNFALGQIRFHHRIRMSTIHKYGFNLVTATGTPADLCTMRKGVITVSGGNINVDVWQIKDATTCPNGITLTTPITQLRIVDGRTYFGLPTKVLWLPFQQINIGVNTLPFRYRFPVNQTDSTKTAGLGTTSFQLALNFGYTWGWSAITTRNIFNYSFTLGGYAGPSTTDLKKGVYKDQTKYVLDQTNATMTYGLNLVLARNNLGLVFAYGWETCLGENSEQWVYNEQPYLAFGINTSFGK